MRTQFLSTFEEKNFLCYDLPWFLWKSLSPFQMSLSHVFLGFIVCFLDVLINSGESHPGWHFSTNSVSRVSFGVRLGLSNFPLSNLSLKVRMYYFNFILFVMPGWHSSLWKEELKGTLCSGCAREPTDVLWTVSCIKEHTDLSTPVLLYVFWFLCAFLSSPLSPKHKTSLETILLLLSLPSNGMENERRTDGDDLKEDITLFTSENNWLRFFFSTEFNHYILGLGVQRGNEYHIFILWGWSVEYLLLLVRWLWHGFQ